MCIVCIVRVPVAYVCAVYVSCMMSMHIICVVFVWNVTVQCLYCVCVCAVCLLCVCMCSVCTVYACTDRVLHVQCVYCTCTRCSCMCHWCVLCELGKPAGRQGEGRSSEAAERLSSPLIFGCFIPLGVSLVNCKVRYALSLECELQFYPNDLFRKMA